MQRAWDIAAGRGDDTHTLDASLCAGHRSTSRQQPARRSGAPPGCPRPLLHSPSCAQRRATVATKAVSGARRAPAPAGGAAGPGVPHCCVRCQGRSLRTPRDALRGSPLPAAAGPPLPAPPAKLAQALVGARGAAVRAPVPGLCLGFVRAPCPPFHSAPPRPCPPSGWSVV